MSTPNTPLYGYVAPFTFFITNVTDGQCVWTITPSTSTDRMLMSSSVHELVSVKPDSGVADPWAAVARPDAEIAQVGPLPCGLHVSAGEPRLLRLRTVRLLPGIVTFSSSGLVRRC